MKKAKIITKTNNVYTVAYVCDVEELIDTLLEDNTNIVTVGDIYGNKVYIKTDSIESFTLSEAYND
ncbi:hypothetical protein [Staphylococcus devriesei]|uniref:hypothetical protein n=1 Tax=Staphylococcus devriesei TaxID=586733 RepID=UPI000CD0EDB3|nr:hypothetical protein [Staphylococcus devriesei]MCE5096538.1 hypothetical protein [Staphylococcus devriesei]PNZ88650.1 hypothetical protein CD147_04890 [Staphylococcus devriesei]SUM04145.1 Uncharacterised protein [Staphylococcus devriesei]